MDEPITAKQVIIDSSDDSEVEQVTDSDARCRVCGQGNAQMHYGALACVGCKGFFRRALKKADQLECMLNGNCVINKDARTNCRSCRLRKCLDAGMKPASVRPDRDFTGKQRKTKKTPERKAEEGSHNDRIPLGNDDWNKRLSVEMKTMLMRLLNIEAKISKGDTSKDATQLYPLHIRTLKEILDDPAVLKGRRSEMRYERYRLCRNSELSQIAYRRLIAAIDWVEYLSEHLSDKLSAEDRIALIKACFTPLLVFKVAARTAVNTTDENVLCMCNFAYIPRDIGKIFEDSYHWSNGLVDRVLNELVTPYRKFNLKEEEIVCLSAICVLNPLAKDLSEKASDMVLDLRNKIQDTLYAVIKESRPSEHANTLYGNILLSLPTVWTMANSMCENLQFAQTFSTSGSIPLMTNLFGCFSVEPFENSWVTPENTAVAVQSLSLRPIAPTVYSEKGVQTDYNPRAMVLAQKRRAPASFTNPVEPRKQPFFSLNHPPCAYTITEMFEDLDSESPMASQQSSDESPQPSCSTSRSPSGTTGQTIAGRSGSFSYSNPLSRLDSSQNDVISARGRSQTTLGLDVAATSSNTSDALGSAAPSTSTTNQYNKRTVKQIPVRFITEEIISRPSTTVDYPQSTQYTNANVFNNQIDNRVPYPNGQQMRSVLDYTVSNPYATVPNMSTYGNYPSSSAEQQGSSQKRAPLAKAFSVPVQYPGKDAAYSNFTQPAPHTVCKNLDQMDTPSSLIQPTPYYGNFTVGNYQNQ